MQVKILSLLFFLLPFTASAKTVRYELTATRHSMNLSGKKDVHFALALNGTIPGPTLEFTEGDEAEILVTNKLPEGEELSIHWHGLLLPNEMDGVPYVTTPPIRAGESYTFRFPLRQNGTYWYHSHTGLQEQKGIFGAFVIHPKQKASTPLKEAVLLLNDWTDEDPDSVLRNLKKDGDYYLYKKGTLRSWAGALAAGRLGTYLKNEWTRMGGMDLSDVGYDAFLVNGKREVAFPAARPGERWRLRVINAAASTYFSLSSSLPMEVISADGLAVKPLRAQTILLGMAETYDILVTVPEAKSFEIRASAQDGTGYASAWLGEGERVPAPALPQPDLYGAMDHNAHSSHSSHTAASQTPMNHSAHGDASAHGAHGSQHQAHGNHGSEAPPTKAVEVATVDHLQAPAPTTLPTKHKVVEAKLVLGGDMARYVWHIDGKAIHESKAIEIQEGDIIRYTLENSSMMHHPMHLHGHFFRVLNAAGESSPLKHTVDVPPHSSRTIEWLANEPGFWMLHCHNLYHMHSGMARVLKYSSFIPKAEIHHLQNSDPHGHDHWYFAGLAEASSNHGRLLLRESRTWDQVETRLETSHTEGKNFSFGKSWDFEGDLFYRRFLDNYLSILGGGTVFAKKGNAVLGLGYTLPFLIHSNAMISHRGKFRLDLEKKFQWTRWLFSDVDFTWRPDQSGEHAAEIEVSLMYSTSWHWAAGLMLTNDSLGGGVEVQF